MKLAIVIASLVLISGCQTAPVRPASGPALDAAAASLNALQARCEICAHNIANAQTIGYKATRAIMADLPYTDRSLTNEQGEPRMARIGAGVHIARTVTDMSQGPAIQTGRTLDLLIEGPGFFKTKVESPEGGGVAYTRAGQLSLNADGELVLLTRADTRVEPNIVVPTDTTQISISSSGRVTVQRPGTIEPQEVGQVQLTCFVNPTGLRPIGGELFVETAESGQPLEGTPGTGIHGTLHQGMLEGSNVNLIAEQVEAHRASQQFEALSRLTFTPSWASR